MHSVCHTHLQTLMHSAAEMRVDIHMECLARHKDRQAKCPSVLSACLPAIASAWCLQTVMHIVGCEVY